MKNDSIEGIYDTLKECAAISKSAGAGYVLTVVESPLFHNPCLCVLATDI
jgi:hypothetical protein